MLETSLDLDLDRRKNKYLTMELKVELCIIRKGVAPLRHITYLESYEMTF